MDKNLTFSKLLQNAKLFVYGMTRGTILFTPRSFKMWEQVIKFLDVDFKKTGVENVSFPALLPLSAIQKEKENFTGFAPELILITQVGKKKLDPSEYLALRPTSEVVFCHYFKEVLNSYRDLPILVNQWTNVWRWEKNTNPFLRTTEFLWNEGHSLHNSQIKAHKSVKLFAEIYGNFLKKVLLIPVIHGAKSNLERFAGSENTLTFETLLPDGQFLQLATTHALGQKFAQVFKLFYLNKENKITHPWQTSWGLSTRVLAGVFLTHCDKKGLIIPPKIADYQIVILLLPNKNLEINAQINAFVEKIFTQLKIKQYRVKIVKIGEKSFGYWANEYEVQGIPLRLEIGAQETKNESITAVPRVFGKKTNYSVKNFLKKISTIFTDIENFMWKKASKQMAAKQTKINSYEAYCNIKNKDSAYAVFFCGEISCEKKIKKETNTTSRIVTPLSHIQNCEKCFHCQKKALFKAIFGRSY